MGETENLPGFDGRPTRALLHFHAMRHPLMTPQDAVKLLYQGEFGGGHLISDPDASLARLEREWDAVSPDPACPPTEPLGDGLVRVMLPAWDRREYPPEALNRDFVRSAKVQQGDAARFRQKLAVLTAMTREGALPFSPAALEACLNPYLEAGCPPVSHSDLYRHAYRPAYRVLRSAYSLPLLLREIASRLERQDRLLVAIDGRCAAGKSTLAQSLGARYGWAVVPMDHFFLRPEQRTAHRLTIPGENIDHERFLEEVLLPLRAGAAPAYRPFDCKTRTLSPPVQVKDSPVTLVEGSYSCHAALWAHYDLRVFLTVSPEVQYARILARNGPEQAHTFSQLWIPLEESYFSAGNIQQRCDFDLELT